MRSSSPYYTNMKMAGLTFLVLIVGLTEAFGSKCTDVSGKWQNDLGSRMVLRADGPTNRITGEYYTAVETSVGAAAFVSNITGLFSRQNDGIALGFSVLFNHGSSLASWVGQCMVCEGKEVMHTTYTLRRYVPEHRDKWTAVVINQNTFWRIDNQDEERLSSLKSISVVSQNPPGGAEIKGKWKSNGNEEIEISGETSDILQGQHLSNNLVGKRDGNGEFTAVTFISSSGKRVRSWTGHVYNAVPGILETSWLEHEFHPSCTSARNMVRFGVQNFTQAAEGSENVVNKSETFFDKLRKFFSNMF